MEKARSRGSTEPENMRNECMQNVAVRMWERNRNECPFINTAYLGIWSYLRR